MSFPRYEKYKDSGVEWLGEVPEHWQIWKLARAFSEIGSGTTPSTSDYDYYDGGDIPWVITGDLNDGRLYQTSKHITDKAISDYTSLRMYPPGSLVFAMYGATIGKVALLELEATVNQACCVFGIDSMIMPEYLYFWFLGMKQPLVALASGGGQPNLSQDSLRGLRVAAPDKDEQSAIAAFLDHETAKIDALVDEQRRLIELLKEKRQTVISHAVTKGLNPDTPMKDSGVEWLGEVPEHWARPPLSYRYECVLGKMLDAKRITGEHLIPYLRNVDVQWDYVRTDELPEMDIDPVERERFTVQECDLLICEGGEVGRTALWRGELEECGFQKAIHRLRPRTTNENPRYLYYTMRFATHTGVFLAQGNPNTIPHLTGEQLRAYRFPTPPVDEQNSIVDYLDEECSRFNDLIGYAVESITMMQERRTALISAAVTGKIDVRNHTPTSEGVSA